MAAEIQKVYLEHPQQRLIKRAVDFLKNGAILVYPTDTIYGLGADVLSRDAFQRILKVKDASSHNLLTLICPDLKEISKWAVVPDHAYRIMRRVIPGQYTFVLRATKQIPKILLQNRKTIGVRFPDSAVVKSLLEHLGRPIISSSVPHIDNDYFTDPEELARRFPNDIDLILDAGVMFNQPSTVVDFTKDEPEIIREGAGDIAALYY
jgi:tRNA threonylcarbamoyl adenosine modification protein (Sua5/YciO/YrdC/YwlC family)